MSAVYPTQVPIKRLARIALTMLAAGAMTLSSVADSLAQGRGGFGGGRSMGGDGMRSPGMDSPGGVGRFPGNDGPRYPGDGGGPRVPGGPGGVIMTPPGGYGPGGPGTVVVVDDDNDPAPQRRRAKRAPQKQKQQQIAQRGGFNPPPAGERRFVPNEVLLNIPAGVSAPALDAIARRHRLTRLDLQDFTLTRRRLARLRINDGRPVATVIRSLQAEARILGAQPNYLFALQQGAAPSARR